MPLFSSPKRDLSEERGERRPNGANGAAYDPQDGERAIPDEHTRLLPNRVDSTQAGYLAPDDPAVSPYNLWSIRALRYLTIAFTLITLVWWILLLVSTFVTPPGIGTRGSPWFAFGFATWTLVNLTFTLLFFEVPSKSVRILAIFLSVSLINSRRILPFILTLQVGYYPP